MKYKIAIVFLSLFFMFQAVVQAAGIPGSSASDCGGEGKKLGLLLLGEGEGANKLVKVIDRAWPEAEIPGRAGEQALLAEYLKKGVIDLRFIRQTADKNDAPELGWGRFTLPLIAGKKPVNLSGKTYLLMSLRQPGKGSGNFIIRLKDAADKEGPKLAITACNLTPIEPGKSVMIALPLAELLKEIDATKVVEISMEVTGPYSNNKETAWALDYLGVSTRATLPGIGHIGMIDAGEHLAFSFEPRGNVNRLRLTTQGGKTQNVEIHGNTFLLTREQVGVAKELQISPMMGELSGAAVTLALPQAQKAEPVTLKFVGPARDHEVSPYVLGSNSLHPKGLEFGGEQLIRWGGNHTSVYNWLEDCTNSSNDWYCVASGRRKPWTNPLDAEWGHFLKTMNDANKDVLLTIPIADWIARNPSKEKGEYQASYPRALYPEQQRFTNGGTGDYGNGRDKDGKYIRMIDRNLTYRPNTPEFQKQWVETIVKHFGPTSKGKGVHIYGLDNEIDLWTSSHFDSCPDGISDEAWVQKHIDFGRAIKQGDPTAKVFGFSGWGNPGCAGKDYTPKKKKKKIDEDPNKDVEEVIQPPHNPRPGQDMITWFLDQMRAASEKEGVQLLDGLTINWYYQVDAKLPDGRKGNLTERNQGYDPVITPLQFELLRYWWDPTFTDLPAPFNSWLFSANRKKLWDPYMPVIPKLHGIIAKHYPGLKLIITEYGLGSEDTMTGALLQVESVGIFMDQDLYGATRWTGSDAGCWATAGIKLLGNWDGKQSAVLGRFRKTATGNKEVTSYATETDTRRNIVLVNRNYHQTQTVFIPAAGAKSYQVAYLAEPTGKNPVLTPSKKIENSRATITLPPFSAAVVVMDLQ